MSEEAFDDIDDDDEEAELDDAIEDGDLDAEDLVLDDELPLENDLVEEPTATVDAVAEAPDPPVVKPRAKRQRKSDDDEEDVLELDEEHHPDDIEDPLDVLLQERTASASLENDEDDTVEEIEIDDRGEGSTKIVPRRPGEFLCQSCFLVLPRSQLSDEKRMLCRDCV